MKNLRTIHRLDRLTSGLLMFGRNPRKAREMEQQIRNRQVVPRFLSYYALSPPTILPYVCLLLFLCHLLCFTVVAQVLKEYVCRVEGEFPEGKTECSQPVEVVSYKIGVCKVNNNTHFIKKPQFTTFSKVSTHGKECRTEFERLSYNGVTSVVVCRPFTGRMHQIRVHLQYLGFPVMNDPLYNHLVFGPEKGKGGNIGKTDEKLISDLISIHNAENWLGMDGDSDLSMFKEGENGEANKDIATQLMAKDISHNQAESEGKSIRMRKGSWWIINGSLSMWTI